MYASEKFDGFTYATIHLGSIAFIAFIYTWYREQGRAEKDLEFHGMLFKGWACHWKRKGSRLETYHKQRFILYPLQA